MSELANKDSNRRRKDAFYFTHDTNAAEDPKIMQMVSVYGLEGYGRYWSIIELMAQQSDYRLDMRSQYARNALAMRLHCDPDALQKYLEDCTKEFISDGRGLLQTDGSFLWSDSLLRRMERRTEISEKARASANSRWNEKNGCESIAVAMPKLCKERKREEKITTPYIPHLRSELMKIVENYTSDLELRDALIGWVEMRLAKEKGFTIRALSLALKTLDKMSDNKLAVVNQSTERGWKTFYPLKDCGFTNSSYATQYPVIIEDLK